MTRDLAALLDDVIEHRRAGRLAEAVDILTFAQVIGFDGLDDEALAEWDLVTAEIRQDQQRHEESLELIEQALTRLATVDNVRLRVHALVRHGEALRCLGRYPDAYRSLDLALELAPSDDERAAVHNDLGVLLKAMGDYPAALTHYRVALAAYDAADARMAALCHNLAGIHFMLGDLEQALCWGRRGVALRRDLAGPDSLDLALDQANLAPILIQAGHLAEARALLTGVIDRFIGELGPDHYEVAVALTNLGALEATCGNVGLARVHLARAADIKRDVLGADSPELIRTLINLAHVATACGHEEQATEALGEARRIADLALPPGHPLRSA